MKNGKMKIMAFVVSWVLFLSIIVQLPVSGIIYASKQKPNDYSMLSKKDITSFKKAEKFIFVKNGVVKFDIKKAKKKKLDRKNLNIGKTINKISETMELYKKYSNGSLSKKNEMRRGMKVWGRYCGPGHSGPGKPKDLLDSLCKKHDKCYSKKGYFACSCDRALMKSILTNLKRMKGKQRKVAVAIYLYFKFAPCNPFR